MKDMITLTECQKKVDEWIKTYGVRYFEEKTNMMLLMEEVGELARLMARKYGEQSFKKQPEDVDGAIESEIGDIFFVLTCLVNQMKMDWNKIITENFSKKTERDRKRHFNNPKLKQ